LLAPDWLVGPESDWLELSVGGAALAVDSGIG